MENFTPRKMVCWFDLRQLANTGIKAVLSSIFGSYADKRETIAAISSDEPFIYSDEKEIWMDYLSDTGDGFDSTYTMAHLIAREKIQVKREKGNEKIELPRSRLVILGGDMVYPVATREMYQDRFVGPYAAALPRDDSKPGVDMFAVPGNHDWYDGLTSFMKLFCQKRWIGNWKTKQHRSYFAIKLTGNTWLWGIDIQLEADIDQPQLHYFEKIRDEKMNEGDNIILCTAEPSWVFNTSRRKDTSYKNLAFFEKKYIVDGEEGKKKLNLLVTLSGDLHHYSHYSLRTKNEKIAHKITAGGGGAFLHPTHNLPQKLANLREGELTLEATFPIKKDSRKLLRNVFRFAYLNWSFGIFLTTIYLLFGWAMYIASGINNTGLHLSEAFSSNTTKTTHPFLKNLLHAIQYNPVAILIIVVFMWGFYKFCDVASSKRKGIGIVGFLHGFSHVLLMFSMLILFSFLHSKLHMHHAAYYITGIVLALFVTWLFAGTLTGAYLFFCNRALGIHDNEAFSAMKIEGFKNFLRIHIKDNTLTIYSIGLKKIARWKGKGNTFSTADSIQPELIEQPIVINLHS